MSKKFGFDGDGDVDGGVPRFQEQITNQSFLIGDGDHKFPIPPSHIRLRLALTIFSDFHAQYNAKSIAEKVGGWLFRVL